MSFTGTLFGPQRPGTGESVRASFVGTRLLVDTSTRLEAEAQALTIEASGYEQEDVLLSWRDSAGDWGLLVRDPAAKAALLAQAPAPLQPALGRWRRSVSATRGIWNTLIATAAVLVVAFAVGWWQYDAVVAWTADRISVDTERKMGLQMLRDLEAGGEVVYTGTAADTLRSIGGRLATGKSYPYEFYLLDDPTVNAFALPGGYIVVNAGLVDAAANADELAGVLAHEIQHVEGRHALRNIVHQLGWATLLALVVGDASAVTSVLLLQAGNSAFSRELETEADLGGIATLRGAGVPPEAMAAFFRTLAERNGDVPRFLSTHPATKERIAAVEAAVRAAPCATCAPLGYDWTAVRDDLVAEKLVRRKPATAR